MNPFQMDTSRRGQVRLPPTNEVWVYLIGTGGTGSYLAQSLARLAWHARTRGIQVHLTFIDPDQVEEKNVGRQLFCLPEVGLSKAETLAARFNAAFGLRIRAIPCPVAEASLESPYGSRTDQRLILGAVDNHLARHYIHHLVTRWRAWWCDAGNEAVAGRVYVGNLDQRQLAHASGLDALGWCRGLPLPSLQDPGLLEAEMAQTPALSCADLTAQDAQSLMINQMMAAVASQYATDFVLHRRLNTYRSVVSLDPPTVMSAPITEAALVVLGLSTATSM